MIIDGVHYRFRTCRTADIEARAAMRQNARLLRKSGIPARMVRDGHWTELNIDAAGTERAEELFDWQLGEDRDVQADEERR